MPAHQKKGIETLQSFRGLASFRLHMLARLSERFYEQFWQREFGLSLLECRIIGVTAGFGQVTFKRACEEANLDKSHASRLVNRLIRRRLLQKVMNPSDQRSVMLALTGAGRDCHRALHVCATRLAEEWLSALPVDERKVFMDAMVKLTEQIRVMSEAQAGRKSRRSGKRGAAPPVAAEPLRELVVNRKMARQLYDLLGTALGNGASRSGRPRDSVKSGR
jgi:DNA-binding MarR family transcriptional regulator